MSYHKNRAPRRSYEEIEAEAERMKNNDEALEAILQSEEFLAFEKQFDTDVELALMEWFYER